MVNQPLVLGSTYRLKFKSTFERHGVCTTPGVTCLHPGGGVFRLEQITNFRDLMLVGVKLYDVFFKPLGITEEEYQRYFDGKPDDVFSPEFTTQTVNNETTEQVSKTVDGRLILVNKRVVTSHEVQVETGRSIRQRHYQDSVNYASYPIYKFVDVIDTNDVIYVPELTIDSFPEIDIREYKNLSLVVHLGYLNDPASLDPMLLSIRERMAAYGWRPKSIKLYSTGTKWLSPTEYDKIKELRIPATIETITENTKQEMLGQMVIMNGSLKKIVNEVSDPVSEIDVNVIMKHKKVIDNRLFMVQCNDDEVFATGDNYYKQVILADKNGTEITCKVLLKEGQDYVPGNACVSYTLATNQTPETEQDFSIAIGGYTRVPYGHHGDYKPEQLLRQLGVSQYLPVDIQRDDRNFETPYYIRMSEADFRPAVESDFKQQFKRGLVYYEKQLPVAGASLEVPIRDHAHLYIKNGNVFVETTDSVVNEDHLPYYYKQGDTYFEIKQWFVASTDTFCVEEKDYFILIQGSGVYRKATAAAYQWFQEGIEYFTAASPSAIHYRAATEEEISDPMEVLYVRNPDRYVTTDTREIGKTYVRNKVWKEVYSTIDALALMGFRMDVDDTFGQTKSIILQLEDIIDIAGQETNVVLPSDSFDYEKFWKKYDGRKFRWVVYPDQNDPTVSTTLEVVVSEDTKTLIAGKAGVLLGQSGQIAKEVYVKDSGQQKRNYYMRYVIQQKQVEDQKSRIAALEQALIDLTIKNAKLEEELVAERSKHPGS